MNSNNKYGLDFRVWGHEKTEKKKDTTPDILKSIGHGWGESSKPKKQKEVVEYTEERIEPIKEHITCILNNARFLPDENTDFGKPCKIRVEIEGESHRLVHLYLWAVYNGEEHDLRHEVEANHNQGICETEMPLFYVEPYHNDVFKNGKKDAKVEYFAKIKMHGAKEIRSELLVMPRPPAILNINEIDGPGSLSHNTKGVYVVKSFTREVAQEEKDSLSWAVKINGKEIERFENVGDSFEYTPGAKYAGETITVHPFLRSPSDNLFIKTTVGQYLLYNGSELLWLDESHKEVGKWKACSNTDTTDPAKENGPLSEGNWVVLQDARDQNMENSWWKELTGKKDPVIWADKNRVELVPFKETDTQGRVEKFYLSGGEGENSSLRGINLAGDIDNFVDKFQKSGKNLMLLVNYSEVLVITKENFSQSAPQSEEYKEKIIKKAISVWHSYEYSRDHNDRTDCSGFCAYLKFGIKNKWSTISVYSFLNETSYNPNVHQFVVWTHTRTGEAVGHMGITYKGMITHFQNWKNPTTNSNISNEKLEKLITRYKKRGGSQPKYYNTGDLCNNPEQGI